MSSQKMINPSGTLYEYGLFLLRGTLNLLMSAQDRRVYNEKLATKKLQKVDPEIVGWFVSELQSRLTDEKYDYREIMFPDIHLSDSLDPALGLCVREVIVAPKSDIDRIFEAKNRGIINDPKDLDVFLQGTKHLRLPSNQYYQLYSKENGVNEEIIAFNPELKGKVLSLLEILPDSPVMLIREAIQEVIEAEQIKEFTLG